MRQMLCRWLACSHYRRDRVSRLTSSSSQPATTSCPDFRRSFSWPHPMRQEKRYTRSVDGPSCHCLFLQHSSHPAPALTNTHTSAGNCCPLLTPLRRPRPHLFSRSLSSLSGVESDFFSFSHCLLFHVQHTQ